MESKRDALWFTVPSHSSRFSLLLYVCSLSISPLLVYALSSTFVSRKGLRNLLLQATLADWKMFCCLGLGGVYYVRCVGEGGWRSAEAYLVLVSMVLQWGVQTKLHSCKTWAILIEWTSGTHKGEERKKNDWQTIREIRVHTHNPCVVFWLRCWTGLNARNLPPVLLFFTIGQRIFLDHLRASFVCPTHIELIK